MNFVAMNSVWYDSSGKIIESKKLAWNRSNLKMGHNYTVSIIYYFENNITPSYVYTYWFNNPAAIDNNSQAFMVFEVQNNSIGWQ